MGIRFNIPFLGRYRQARSFVRHPGRYIARKLFRVGLSIGIFGISIGLGGIRLSLNLGILSILFGGRKRKGGGGGGSKGGGSKGSGKKSGGSSGGGEKGGGSKGGSPKGGGEKSGGSQSGGEKSGASKDGGSQSGREKSSRGSGAERRQRGERLAQRMERAANTLRQKRARSSSEERDEMDRAERDQQTKRNSRAKKQSERKKSAETKVAKGQTARGATKRDTPTPEKTSQDPAKTTEDQAKRARDAQAKAAQAKDELEKEAQAKRARDAQAKAAQAKDELEKEAQAKRARDAQAKADREERDRANAPREPRAQDEKINRPIETFTEGVHQTEFNINQPLPFQQRVLLEASAGTGKTFSLTSLVARYVAEENLKIDQLLMVTFTKAAASEMKERTRAKLNEALIALESGVTEEAISSDEQWMRNIVACDQNVRTQRISRLKDAISSIDAAMITTIHGFFQQALREVGLRSADTASSEIANGKDSVARQTLRDELIRQFAAGPVTLMNAIPEKTPNDLETQLLEVIRGLDSNISAVAAPQIDDGTVAYSWATFVNQIRKKINHDRVNSGAISFDDLITGLRDLLNPKNPLSADVIEGMRARYRLVLIDEFQDTDDTQWDIFSRIFDVELLKKVQGAEKTDTTFLAMIMVGDPKQAIYRFRGADIAAYLKAVEDPELRRFEMKSNFRSDRNLIVGLNRMFQGTVDENGNASGFKFGNKNIAFIQVDAAKKGKGSGLQISGHDDDARALQMRWIATDVKPSPTVGVLRPRIAEDLANHVTLLLNEGTIPEKVNGIEVQRRVQPGDISILVRTHGDAEPVVEALRHRGIPVVKSSIGSVAQSEATGQLRTLLSAMAMPNDNRRVKALGLSWFMNFDVIDLLDEKKIIDLGLRCNEWANLLLDRGIVGFFQTLRSDVSVMSQISKSVEAERRLTDLEHLAELIHRSTDGKKLAATSVLRHLDEIAKVEDESDEMLRRIDSDAKAIQITTMHSSKGLEYPIVLIPFPKAPNSKGAEVFTYGGRRFVNAAPAVDWAIDELNSGTRKAITKEEIEGDDLRLMYVAFTRAKHQLVVWWAKSQGVDKSPLARLLFGNHEDITQATSVLDGNEARVHLRQLTNQVGVDDDGQPIMHLRELQMDDDTVVPLKDSEEAEILPGKSSDFPRNGVRNYTWKRWSFSSLSSSLKHDDADSHKGGTDEGDEGSSSEPIEVSAEPVAIYSGVGLFAMPASAEFGTLVHEVLEKVNFTSPTLREDLLAVISSYGSEVLKGISVEDLAQGLFDSLQTPLDPLIPGFRFADLDAHDRLAEMDFHFSLPNTSVSKRMVAEAAAKDSDSMFAAYFQQLAQTWSADDSPNISGLMTGSIDVLFRVRVAGLMKYFVVDYKSNRLHRAGEQAPHSAYEVSSMKKAMESHHYPLQALFYCVALHRFLSNRISDYDIERDLGGAGYLFVRGMVGSETPTLDGVRNGVLSWRPSSQTILAANAILGGEGQ